MVYHFGKILSKKIKLYFNFYIFLLKTHLKNQPCNYKNKFFLNECDMKRYFDFVKLILHQ